jgi:hypothetical protein
MKRHILPLLILFIFMGLHQATAQVSFVPAATNNVGRNPFSVTVADVNDDGKVDLVCANGSDSTLTVLTNNGYGVFGFNATLPVGSQGTVPTTFVVAADVNGDGKVDLISANYGSSSLTLLTNNGVGTFGFNASIPTGGNTIGSITAADLNADDKIDLVVTHFDNSNISILTNNGNGVFGLNATYNNVGNGPKLVSVANLNEDGKPDLIIADEGNTTPFNNTVTILTNNGSGLFGFNASYTVGVGPTCVAVADVNGDGKPDLISANYNFGNSLGTLTVLTNNGNGIFGSNATYIVGSEPAVVIAADVNGDGKVDLISVNAGSSPNYLGTLSVLTNDGIGNFALAASPAVGGRPFSFAMADVNGDGRPDFISANFNDNTVMVLTNSTIFPPPTSTPALTMHCSGSGMIVSWPSASAGWSLQQNSTPATNNWSPSGYSCYGIGDDGTNKSLIIKPATGNMFFRLLHP